MSFQSVNHTDSRRFRVDLTCSALGVVGVGFFTGSITGCSPDVDGMSVVGAAAWTSASEEAVVYEVQSLLGSSVTVASVWSQLDSDFCYRQLVDVTFYRLPFIEMHKIVSHF